MNRVKLVEQFLKWVMAWALLLDGLIGIFTFGFVFTTFALGRAKHLARWRSKND